MAKSTAIQIYLKQEVEEDELLLRLWKSAVERSRAQTLFRRMLLKGYQELKDSGDIPPGVLEAMHDDDILQRSRRSRQQRRPRTMETAPQDLVDEVVSDPDLKPAPQPSPGPAEPSEPATSSTDERPSPTPKDSPTQQSDTPIETAERAPQGRTDGDYSFIGDLM